MPTSRTKHVTGKATSVKTLPPAVGYERQSSPLPSTRSKFDTLPRKKPGREALIAKKVLPGDNAPKPDPSQGKKKVNGWKEKNNAHHKNLYRWR